MNIKAIGMRILSQNNRMNHHKEESQGQEVEKTIEFIYFLIIEYYNRVYTYEPKKNLTGNKGETSEGLV